MTKEDFIADEARKSGIVTYPIDMGLSKDDFHNYISEFLSRDERISLLDCYRRVCENDSWGSWWRRDYHALIGASNHRRVLWDKEEELNLERQLRKEHMAISKKLVSLLENKK